MFQWKNYIPTKGTIWRFLIFSDNDLTDCPEDLHRISKLKRVKKLTVFFANEACNVIICCIDPLEDWRRCVIVCVICVSYQIVVCNLNEIREKFIVSRYHQILVTRAVRWLAICPVWKTFLTNAGNQFSIVPMKRTIWRFLSSDPKPNLHFDINLADILTC